MKVWELIATASKAPAGAEVLGRDGTGFLCDLTDAEMEGTEEILVLNFETPD